MMGKAMDNNTLPIRGRIVDKATIYILSMCFIYGCATDQIIPRPISSLPGPGMARINLVRRDLSSNWIRMEINDNEKVIGKIKDGETLSWDRAQGLMRLSVTPVFNTPFKNIAPLILDVKQGYIYHINIKGQSVSPGGVLQPAVIFSTIVLERIERSEGIEVKVPDIKPDKNKIDSLSSRNKELPKIAVWNLSPGNIPPPYAQDLTSILVSEVVKLRKYEVISQENIRTVAGWTEEKMKLGCTDTKCLMALGQMDISKLISGRVGRIGSTYSISLHLFDTQKIKSDNSVSEECHSEDELISLIRRTVRKLFEE